MQTRTSIEKALEKKLLNEEIQRKIDEALKPLAKENEKLKRENEDLRAELSVQEAKFSTVRQQLQMLSYFLPFDKLVQNKKVEQLGSFFSGLLNRHPQRARKQFSAINELFYSANKQTAKNIKSDLLKTKQLFTDFGLHKKAALIQAHIKRLDQKHFNDSL